MAPKVTNYLGYFCNKICLKEHFKIARSGRTDHIPIYNLWLCALSLVHTSHRLQQLLQRARSLQIIGKFSIFTATDCNQQNLKEA